MIMYRFSDGIVVYGDHVKRFIIGIDKYSETKIFTAYQVVENARFNSVISAQIKNDIRKELLIRNEQPIILCVCRIEKEKGVFDIIAAFKKLKNDDAVLLFIGNGSQNKSFEIEISQPQFSRVKWIKQIENSKLVQYYSIASVLCLFSKTGKTWKEPWGIVINEAMNQGLPCIASDAVGAAVGGLIKNGRNGLIVPEGDVDSLVIALESIVNNSERQCEMSLNAREDIAEWTYDMMAKGFVNAINYVRQKNS
jgi:glycosyltransferase involved in cell wall biosynthesis